MIIWSINIDLIGMWYYFIIGIFLTVGIVGWALHYKDTSIPILWAIIMSIILFTFSTELYPILFGFQYYTMYSLEWCVSGYFSIAFLLLNLTFGYNIIKSGTVIE